MAQGLEGGGGHDTEPGENKVDTDGPQCRDADFQHVVRRLKDAQQRPRAGLERRYARQHDAHGVQDTQLDRAHHPLRLLCAEVIGHNGDHTVVHAEDGHKDEALQLEVCAQDGSGRGGESNQDFIQAEGHHRADGGHGNGGQTHGIDTPDDAPVRTEAPEGECDFRILFGVEVIGQHTRHNLAQGGCHRRACNAHAAGENEDGVENDVGQRTGHLGNHGVEGLSGGLQQTLQGNLDKDAQGTHGTDQCVNCAAVHDLRHVRLHQEKLPGKQRAGYRKQDIAANSQKHTVGGGQIGPLKIFLPQALAQQGVDAHTRTGCHGDHQVLHREGQAHRVQGVLTDMGHIHAVHDIIQCLHQHRQHNGYGHAHQQAVDRHNAHFVFLLRVHLFFFHSSSLVILSLQISNYSIKKVPPRLWEQP